MVKINDLLKQNVRLENDKKLYCLIGQAQDGSVRFCDISKAPHILVGGNVGEGRRMILHSIILSLASHYSPKEVGIVLLEPQEGTFPCYYDLPHLLYKGFPVSTCLDELEERIDGQKATDQKIVVVIDELIAFTKDQVQVVEKLVRLGHGVGIHVVLATRKMEHEYLSPVLKSCLQTVVACKVATQTDSLYLLGKSGAEYLSEIGEIIYRGRFEKEVPLALGWINYEEVRNLVKRIMNDCIAKGDLMDGAHVCPVCGKTIFSSKGSYEICAVCGWEDETWCEEYPDEESTANYCSLNEYRRRHFQEIKQD